MSAHNTSISFRDPLGRVTQLGDKVLRELMSTAATDYNSLKSSGLYKRLTWEKLLVEHQEVPNRAENVWLTLQPELIEPITYPEEWGFEQLRDAALLTLRIQKIALAHGMTLKDAQATNVQFRNGRPIFIDTLSFTKWDGVSPWRAYRQFCEQFLGPLALRSYWDPRIGRMSTGFMSGIPLDMVSKALPYSSYATRLLIHVHLHAKFQANSASGASAGKSSPKVTLPSSIALVENLEKAIHALKSPARSVWRDYYKDCHYREDGLIEKENVVLRMVEATNARRIIDVGCNTGRFCELMSEKGAFVLGLEQDPICVDHFYERIKSKPTNTFPLVYDFAAPTPDMTFNERRSLKRRLSADLVTALAVIHHIRFTSQIPFDLASQEFANWAPNLVIEFVPASDPMTQKIGRNQPTIMADYTQANFESAFNSRFNIIDSHKLKSSDRVLYFMQRKM